jgi:hypothetical protein
MNNSNVSADQDLRAQKAKSKRKLWLWGCGGGIILLCTLIGIFASSLFPAKDLFDGEVSYPDTVKIGDSFDFVVTLTNPTQEPVLIEYFSFPHYFDSPILMDAVKVISIEPDMKSELNSLGDIQFLYHREIKPGETQKVTFHLQAEKSANYLTLMGVYAIHPLRPVFHFNNGKIEIEP